MKVYTSDQLVLPDSTNDTDFSLIQVPVENGKQKMADTKIVRDVLHLLRTVIFSERSTVVMLSGDADMIPALEDIAEEKKWTVKIYSWDHCKTYHLTEFQEQYESKVSIVSLNTHWDTLIFRKNETVEFPEESSLVFTRTRNTPPNWRARVETLSKRPVQYKEVHGQKNSVMLVLKGMDETTKTSLGAEIQRQQLGRCETYKRFIKRTGGKS